MKTAKFFFAIVLALSLSGCLSSGLLLGKYGNTPEHVAKAPVEHLYVVTLLQLPTRSQPVVEVQLIDHDHAADNTPVVITSSQGKRMLLISDERGKLQVNLVAHFAEKQLAPGEVVLNHK